MDRIGRTFLFDYGGIAIKVRYPSDTTLEWEQVRGPGVGLKGRETCHAVEVRPGAWFIWWQEKDTSVVAQVVDFQERMVYTTWISPEKKVEQFQGTIRPQGG
jgi:hypothetical protein